ncbi:MAG: AAA family ATPase, partial [bacterium]|nr:AAA family ATPase [bacterium]
MLDYLKVENFAVVEKAELFFSPNLNVLTGETGAGKSIVIGAINHLLKKKVAENAIRGEAEKLVVEAMFSEGDDEFVLRREVNKKKSFCYINGSLVPFIHLKEKAENLLNIYGQNEHIFLLNSNNHRLFLDQYGGNYPILGRIAQQYGVLNQRIAELEELKQKSKTSSETLDFINFQIEEINDLKMEKGDDATLEQRLKILSSAEEILTRSKSLIREFYQRDNSVYNIIAERLKDMEYLKEIYPDLGGLNEELNRFYNYLPELSNSLSNITGHVDYNEEELNRIETRLLKLNRLKSKYHMELDGLLEKRDRLTAERDLLGDMDFSLQEKQKEIDKEFHRYRSINLELRQRREKHARR